MFDAGADSYDRLMGRYSRHLAPQFAAFAGISPGMRALDVGCGTGVLSKTLASIVGAEQVAAADPQPQFVDAVSLALPDADVRVANAEDLPWEDETFDAALAQLVVSFMADAPAGVAEMCRVTRPGGTVAAAMWDRDKLQVASYLWSAVAAAGITLGPSADVMRYRNRDELVGLLTDAGLADLRTEPLSVASQYESVEDLWETYTLGVGPIGAFVQTLSAPQRESVRGQLYEVVREEVGSTAGPLELTATAWAVAGTRR